MIKKFFLFIFVLALGMAAGLLLYPRLSTRGGAGKPGGERKILYYVDPMHPAYKSDKPGVAPDCGMKLEPVYADSGPTEAAMPSGPTVAAGAQRRILYYVDPMNPSYKSDKPGLAPDGMKLEPVYADSGTDQPAEPMPQGTVKITAEKQQLIGVRYGEVRTLLLSRTTRAVAKVTYDETRIARIHAKIDGWIEQVSVDFVGKLVEKGQPLLSIYSPELVATQQEFLLAAKAQRYLSDSPVKEVASGAESLYAAARKRLELWDVTEEQVQELVRRNAPVRTMTLFSPISGYVLTRNAFPRQRVTPETELYTVADLSTVWVMADLYEYETKTVKLGQQARMTLAYYPGRPFQGKVVYIYPQVDNTTRTIKVRLEFPNPDLQLKPDMYANVEFIADHGRQLAVPEEAVMNSGLETTVFVDRGNGYLEPRKVELGEKVDGQYIVLAGLKQGERVVISGNFLVDSESRLKSAAAGMGGGHGHGGPPKGEAAPAAPAGPQPRAPEAAPSKPPAAPAAPAGPQPKAPEAAPSKPPAAPAHGGHRP